MRIAIALATLSVVGAFQAPSVASRPSSAIHAPRSISDGDTSRKDFLQALTTGAVVAASSFFVAEPALARGRATLEKSYERYVPRIRAGGEFYGTELRKLVAANDFAAIKNSLQEPPERTKEDLSKPDAGVAERARQAGRFSDARVLVAADLYAGAFSDNSISEKTKKMKTAVEKVRAAVNGMASVARQALGEEKSGGLFGFGAKKPSKDELAKDLRKYYVEGGNAWNEYIYAANEDLALQFDRLPFIAG